MPEYRRAYRPGGTFFFTIVTHRRRRFFSDRENVGRLREALRQVRKERPFELVAAVIIPDHLHFIWMLPSGDPDYSARIGRVKILFGQSLDGSRWETSGKRSLGSRGRHRESQVWQRRFWEHTIRDERDFENHLNYLHYNPVKHGLCQCPHQWEASSFQKWAAKGVYEMNWQCQCNGRPLGKPYPNELDQKMGE